MRALHRGAHVGIQQPGDDAAVVGFAVVRHLWLVLLTPIVYATLGLIVGWLLTTFVPMPPEHRRLCLSMVAVGSSTGWPIVLLSAFDRVAGGAWAPNVNGVTPLLCVCVLVLTAGAAQHATLLLVNGPTRDDEPLSRRGADQPPPKSALRVAHLSEGGVQLERLSNRTSGAGTSKPSGVLRRSSDFDGLVRREGAAASRRISWADLEGFDLNQRASMSASALKNAAARAAPSRARCAGIARALRRSCLSPPVLAVLGGFACASIAPAYWLLCGGAWLARRTADDECPASPSALVFVASAAAQLGDAFAPVHVLLVGASLSRPADWKALPMRYVGIIVAGKMVLLPGAALLFATLLYHTIGNGGLDTFALRNPTDRTVYFVTMLLAGAPTASTAGAALAGGMRKAVGAVLYAEYASAALCVPIGMALSLWVALNLVDAPSR